MKVDVMKIHETTLDDGALAPITLEVIDEELVLTELGVRSALPAGALAAVFRRLGRELEAGARLMEMAELETPEGTLRHVRHLDMFDVIARDWLVLDGRGALATTVAGALSHLAAAYASR